VNTYQHQPDSTYGIELRGNESVDDYIANARRFRSTAEFIEYRDASASRKAEIRANRDNHSVADDAHKDDLLRRLAVLKVCKL
jgi:hypothetical protein